jgi:Aspartyl protease/Tetratricopeptide repeat
MMGPAGIRRLLVAVAAGLCFGSGSVAVWPEPASGASTEKSGSQSAPAPTAKAPAPSPSVAASDAPLTPLGEAMDFAQKGNFEAAIKRYQEVIQQKPNSPDAYAGLTRCYLKKEDVQQAYETVTQALKVTDAWPVHVALGEVYFRQGKIPEAEKEWVGVINAGHPNAARAYLGLARVRWAITMNKSAKDMIERAHTIDPDDREIERLWIDTLPHSERIKYYESYLSENTSDEEHGDLARYLSYLKERAKQPNRPCRLVSKVTHTETPLVRLMTDPSHMRGYGLSVDLNGTHSHLMLDTGASGIVVNRGLAGRAGITKVTETKIWGVGDKGRRNAFIGTAATIRIGQLEFHDCPVEVMESRSVAGEQGLIGADVFEDFLVEINFPDEKLKLSELPKRPGEAERPLALKNDEDDGEDPEPSDRAAGAPAGDEKKAASAANLSGPQDRYIGSEMQSYTHVYRFGHDLLIPTKIGAVPNKLFLLDTGALTNCISPEAAREVTKVHGDSDTIVKGISGSVKNVFSANKAVLQFGHLRQENQDMLSFDTKSISDDVGTEVSGFFGFVMLRFLDIKIDYRDGLIDFSYDAKRFGGY